MTVDDVHFCTILNSCKCHKMISKLELLSVSQLQCETCFHMYIILLYTVSAFSLELLACCPKVTPAKKVEVAGASLNFTCVVDMSRSLPKYLSFKWFKKVNGTYLEIPDEQTHRQSGGTSVLKIKNAQTTPPNGNLYTCQMDYRGKIRNASSRVVVFSG